MTKLIYILKSKIPTSFYDFIIDGQNIRIGDLVYTRLEKRPPNRRPIRRLKNLNSDELITIYG